MINILSHHLKILNDMTPCTPIDATKYNLDHDIILHCGEKIKLYVLYGPC